MAKMHANKKHASANGSEKGSGFQQSAAELSKPALKKAQKLIMEPKPDWHANTLPVLSAPKSLAPIPLELLESVHNYAKTLLDAEASKYASTNLQASSSHKFMSTIMSSGTLSDKVSALTLVVQESPLHTSKSFENLVNLASKRSRSQAIMALGAVKDLLAQGVVLPSDRKLRMFSKQPALLGALQKVKPPFREEQPLPNGLEKAHLIQWAFEDRLKHLYFEILKLLERWSYDEVEFARLRAITFVWELLKEKPEQEENLLRLLVNKLGDTNKKVASRASHLLLQLQVSHPSMKSIIISNIESEILLRPGQSLNAKYYAVITLNQTVLQTSDPALANTLLEVYFNLFVTILNKAKNEQTTNKSKVPAKKATKKKRRGSSAAHNESSTPDQELEDKIVAQVLTGVNRAFPYSKKDTLLFEKHLDTMFRIAHSSNFNTSVQALMLIQQISASHQILSDRYMRTLYESLLDSRLVHSSKQTMYLNLLYRSLKSDASLRRVKAFVKRLLQIINLHEPPFICAVLYLIMELRSIFPGINSMLEQPEQLAEDDEEVFVDVPEDGVPPSSNHTQPATKPRVAGPIYDPRKRDPEHAHAELTCLWELTPWLNHYHPSISLFARHLLNPSVSHNAPPKPDPTSHTISHFLDRFVYRNPKQRSDANMRGTSLMQPALGTTNAVDTLLVPGGKGTEKAPLNSEAFWKKRAEEVAPEDVFFHRYFAVVGPRRKVTRGDEARKKKDKDDMDEWEKDEADIGDEDEIWKALVESRPELEGDGEEGSGFSDADEDVDVDYEDSDEEMGEDGSVNDEFGEDEDMEFDEEAGEDDESDAVPFNIEEEDSDDMSDSADGQEGEVDDDDDEDAEQKAPISKENVGQLKRKDDESQSERQKRRKKLRSLPTFASAEDYAHLLGQDEEDDMGDGVYS